MNLRGLSARNRTRPQNISLLRDTQVDEDAVRHPHPLPVPESLLASSCAAPTSDLDCASRVDPSVYRLLDWNEITSGPEFIAATSMQLGEGLLVQWNGQRFYDQTRHYFMARHDHNPPGNFMIHAEIDNSLLDLGSWYGINMRVACYKP